MALMKTKLATDKKRQRMVDQEQTMIQLDSVFFKFDLIFGV
jgi:hypothetical protein